jgi:DNA-3-methyladenine glycosylase II
VATPIAAAPAGERPAYWLRARRNLAAADPTLARIIDAHPRVALASRGDAFVTLARSIVGQQISVKAADAVWNRFSIGCGQLTPRSVLRRRAASLRACGLSERKVEYIRDLARHFEDGRIDPSRFSEQDDEQIIAELIEIRGIGRWTAEMFLIFNLLRPNVLPLDDLGLLRAVSLNYFKGKPINGREGRARLDALAQRWAPWRSVATWYLWRSLDPVSVEY